MKTSKQLFQLFVKGFEDDTMFSSFVEDNHPYFKSIVVWGKERPTEVIPWLLEIINTNWHWCHALWQIVDKAERPTISEEMIGRSDLITKVWLTWGKTKGYS